MARRGANRPLLIVCSLLSYRDSRLRFCRSWKVLTLRQFILLALSSLKKREEKHSNLLLIHVLFYIMISVHCTNLVSAHTQMMRWFTFPKSISITKPQLSSLVIFLSLFLPLSLQKASPTLSSQLWLYFCLALTHKSKNCGFMYFPSFFPPFWVVWWV